MVDSLERKIQFYQIMWVKKSKGEKLVEDINFINDILSKNRIINYDATYDLLLEEYDHKVYSSQTDKSLWKLSKIRKYDYPLKYNYSDMQSSPLDLKGDEGLSEQLHFAIFEGSIIGAEYNHYGPRVQPSLTSTINSYLKLNSTDGISRVEIKPILRTDIYDLIDKFVEISGVSIQIATDYAKLLKSENKDNKSFEKMFSAVDLVDDMYLRLAFTVGRGKKRKHSSEFQSVIDNIRTILGRNDMKNNLKVLEIDGIVAGHDSPTSVNLLKELMMTEKQIARLDTKTKAVDSDEMYKGIIDSYSSLNTELKRFISQAGTG